MSLIDKEKLINEMNTRAEEEALDFRDIRNIVQFAPTVKAIPIPEGATNGDMIKAMFPNCEQKERMNNGYFEMYFDNDFGNASYMRINKDWWNAPYKVEREE